MDKNLFHRGKVLEQWVVTEESYRQNLDAAINYIKKPMLEKAMIGKQQISVLFPQFEGMLQLSNNMVLTISNARKQQDPNKVMFGEQLNHFAMFYKLYGTYFGCRMRSEKLLRELATNYPDSMQEIQINLRAHIKQLDARKMNMTISDCLQQPQYRMFKYVLLIKDYLKKLSHDHKDYQPLTKALGTFESINLANNDLMQKLQGLEKKAKLDRLFGKNIGNSSEYIVQMSAQTIYFPVKLYIFNNLVIVSIAENMIGFREEKRYTNLYLTESSFIHLRNDTKYFKNILLLCGQHECLHLFLPDTGTRLQIYNIMIKVFTNLRAKGWAKRQQKLPSNQIQKSNQITIVLDQVSHSNIYFYSQLRIQVLSVDIRPIGSFSNDTVYVTRFMLPTYPDDEISVRKQQNSETVLSDTTSLKHNGICQYVEIHLSQLVELHKELKQEYPQIQFPQIDPLTKQLNLITESKKNTKTFEVRSFLMEQFFNFLFRHPVLMQNPLWIVKKYGLLSQLWQYACEKNQYLFGKKEQSFRATSNPNNKSYKFGDDHCQICKQAIIPNLQAFQKYRRMYQVQDKKNCCFNFYSLLRCSLLRFPYTNFNTLQRILVYDAYYQGRIDYLFIERDPLSKTYYGIKVAVAIKTDQQSDIDVYIDGRTKIGHILADIASEFEISNLLDFRLVLRFNGIERILDQDQVVIDIVKMYQLEFQEKQGEGNRRSSVGMNDFLKNQGILGFFKDLNPFSTKSTNKIILKKIIFLDKHLEVASMKNSLSRSRLVAEQFFYRLSKSQIRLDLQPWGQMAALFYIVRQGRDSQNLNSDKILLKVGKYIIPEDKSQIARNKLFFNAFNNTIQYWRKQISNSNSQYQLQAYQRCLQIAYQSINTYTYSIPVLARIVPDGLVLDALGRITGSQCLLGVNFRQIVVLRDKLSTKAAVRLPLEDIEVIASPFSIFIKFSSYISKSTIKSSISSGDSFLQKEQLRFDSKMLYGMYELINLYKLINTKFSQNQE